MLSFSEYKFYTSVKFICFILFDAVVNGNALLSLYGLFIPSV